MRWLLLLLIGCSAAPTTDSSPEETAVDAATQPDTGTATTPDAAVDAPLAILDSSSPDVVTSDWSTLRPELVDVSVRTNGLTLRATAYSLWYNASRGPMVYKRVTGDFGVRARVRTLTAGGAAPPRTVHLGGLMARQPSGTSENYVFVVVGHDVDDLSVETKTTANSASTYEGPSWPSSEAELRLCRAGSSFRLYKRAVGSSTWTLAQTYDRPDLPAALDVGAVMYAAAQNPDLVVTYDDIQFESGC